MALSANRLGDAMKAAIDAVGDKTDRTAVFRALATAIVLEVQGHAQVVVASVSGVTTGGGTSGPGTGTVL